MYVFWRPSEYRVWSRTVRIEDLWIRQGRGWTHLGGWSGGLSRRTWVEKGVSPGNGAGWVGIEGRRSPLSHPKGHTQRSGRHYMTSGTDGDVNPVSGGVARRGVRHVFDGPVL